MSKNPKWQQESKSIIENINVLIKKTAVIDDERKAKKVLKALKETKRAIKRCPNEEESEAILKILFETIETTFNECPLGSHKQSLAITTDNDNQSKISHFEAKLNADPFTSKLNKYRQDAARSLHKTLKEARFDVIAQALLGRKIVSKYITLIRKAPTEEKIDHLFEECLNEITNLVYEASYETGTRLIKKLKWQYFIMSLLVSIVMFTGSFIFQRQIETVYSRLTIPMQIWIVVCVMLSQVLLWMLRLNNLKVDFSYNLIISLIVTVGFGVFVMLHEALMYGYALSGMINLISMIIYILRYKIINSKFYVEITDDQL